MSWNRLRFDRPWVPSGTGLRQPCRRIDPADTVSSMTPDRFSLAGSDISVSPMGVGTWAWGDRSTWGMGGTTPISQRDDPRGLRGLGRRRGDAVRHRRGLRQRGERADHRKLLARTGVGQVGRGGDQVHAVSVEGDVHRSLLSSLRASLERLGVKSVDLYQIHGPISFRRTAIAEALAAAHQAGLVRAVGVSTNRSRDAGHRCHAPGPGAAARLRPGRVLAVPSAPETSGVLATCKELGVVPRVLAHRSGAALREVLGGQPAEGEADVLRAPMAVVDSVVAELRRV